MAKSIYIAGISAGSGKSLISIGLMSLLKSHFEKVAFFKPIANIDQQTDEDIYVDLMQDYFSLPYETKELFALTHTEAEGLLAKSNENELVNRTLSAYKKLENSADFVLVEGTDFSKSQTLTEFSTNATLANNLGCEVLLVAGGKDKTLAQIIQQINVALSALKEAHSKAIGVVVNHIQPHLESEFKFGLKAAFRNQLRLIHTITQDAELAEPSVAEIAQLLGAEIVCGNDQLTRRVAGYTVAAKHVASFLNSRKDRKNLLIITPGDREDILLGSMLADQSQNYPKIAGLLMTTNESPRSSIMDIVSGLPHPFPVLKFDGSTFDTANLLANAVFHTNKHQTAKIKALIEHFQSEVNAGKIINEISESTSSIVTPQMFSYQLIEKAKSDLKHIVLPEGEDPRILQAASFLHQRRIVSLTILGEHTAIEQVANRHNIDLSGINIINPATSSHTEHYAKTYYELRKHKNVNETIAHDRLQDTTYFATMMVYFGDADGMVSGAMHTTGETIKPALETIKTAPNAKKVSSIFLMCLADRVLVYGDCAVNPEPDSETLAEIAIQSALNAKRFGISPKVALLSYSSGSSGSGESVDKVREATKIAHEKAPDLLIEGPLQYDAAIDPSVAAKKMPDSDVAGQATVLIFPDLNTGNNTYKAVQRETGAIAIGPVLQGLAKPVNDLSRGCTVPDIINTVVITAIQAQGTEE